jgi:hypothetical protein
MMFSLYREIIEIFIAISDHNLRDMLFILLLIFELIFSLHVPFILITLINDIKIHHIFGQVM